MKIHLYWSICLEFVSLGLTLVSFQKYSDWTYKTGNNGPPSWVAKYPECGKAWWQSPVDIPWDTTAACMEPIKWTNIDTPRNHSTLQNAWRVVKLHFPENEDPLIISGGPLPKGVEYYFAGSAFHIGSKDNFGSIHHVKGKAYPGEISLYFTNDPLANETSFPWADSIVIVDFFLDVSEENNPNWDPLIRNFPKILRAGSFTEFQLASFRSLLPQYQTWENKYFLYIGSIAAPPCSDRVIRIVYTTPINLSSKQLNAFRQSCDEDGTPIVNNTIGLQPTRHNQFLRSFS